MTGNTRFSNQSSMQTRVDKAASSAREMQNLQSEIEALRARVAEQATEIQRLDELAETDALTGIGNRRCFQKEINRRHAEQQRDGRKFCLMIIDVDGFKGINDRRGHMEGDQLLQKIANLVDSSIRSSDIVFRIGGDEFAILLPGASLKQAETCATRLVESTVATIQSQMPELPVGLSIGVVQSTGTRAIEELIHDADAAMYRAKKSGGNRFKSELFD